MSGNDWAGCSITTIGGRLEPDRVFGHYAIRPSASEIPRNSILFS
jgi:hypothetical protein